MVWSPERHPGWRQIPGRDGSRFLYDDVSKQQIPMTKSDMLAHISKLTKQLERRNKELLEVKKELDEANETSLECVVCRSARVNVVFLPCGHLCVCTNCCLSLDNCPLCRCDVSETHRIYMPIGDHNDQCKCKIQPLP